MFAVAVEPGVPAEQLAEIVPGGVRLAQADEPAPRAARVERQLPSTAGSLPLVLLAGLVSLLGGLGLTITRRFGQEKERHKHEDDHRVRAAWTLIAAVPCGCTQGTQQEQAIASSEVLSRISMFNYRKEPTSDLPFRGTRVPASSIDVAGLGQSRRIGDYSTSDGRARKRRVEIVISGGPLGAR